MSELGWPLEPLPPKPAYETAWRLMGPTDRVIVCRIGAIPRTVVWEVRIVDEDDRTASFGRR